MFWQRHGIEKKDLLMPGSILLGSIIIAGSIYFGVNMLTSGSLDLAKGGSNPQQQVAPTGGKVSIDKRNDAPKLGNGKVEVVEFSDFQCPYCQQFVRDAYAQIKSKYIDTGKITFVFRHFPLTQIHPFAQKTAEAAECANRQGKFSSYHDLVFVNAKPDGVGLGIANLKQYAITIGLDTVRFNQCLDGSEAASAVKTDLDAGGKAGVTGTPTFFINGEKLVGAQPFSAFQTAIDKALK